MLRNWWRRQQVNSPTSPASRPRATPTFRFRPQVEALEERCAPTVSLAVGPNVDTGPRGGNQNEPTIAINPTNPNNLFVASNDEPSAANTGGLFTSVSFDGGATWAQSVNFTAGNFAACCDPEAVFDHFGNLFLVYIDNATDGVNIARSKDGGQTFQVLAIGNAAGNDDQPQVAVGPSSVWVSYADVTGGVSVQGSRDTGFGGALNFSAPAQLPGSLAAAGNFGDIGVGPNGQVTVTYQDNSTAVSSGQGQSTIYVNTNRTGLNGVFGPQVVVTGTNIGGGHTLPPVSNNFGIDAEANLAYDNSNDAFRGRLYMVYTDGSNQFAAVTSILTRYSDNNGATWSAPVTVNDSAINSRFLPTIACDPVTGVLAISWYDSRNAGSLDATAQLFGSISSDGGNTWAPNVQISAGTSNAAGSEPPASPNLRPLGYGDFIKSTAFYNGVYYPIWADNSNSTGNNPDGALLKMDVYTAKCVVDTLPVVNVSLSPNPGVANHPISLIGVLTSVYAQSGFTVAINWGDGSAVQQLSFGPGGSANLNVTHVFSANGTYTVTLRVTDINGGSTVVTFTEKIGAAMALTATGTDVGVPADVRVFDDASGNPIADVQPFGAFEGGVRVAIGDVNGDGTRDIICAAGPGGLPEVVVYDGKTLQIIREFLAFGGAFRGGLFVAAGDISGKGYDDIIVGADAGGGPEVEVFDGKTGAMVYNFYAFNPLFRGGVRVAAADLNGDGIADIICGAGPGGLPEVTAYNGATGQLLSGSAIDSFFAFGQIPNTGSGTPSAGGAIPFFTGGIYVAAGDVNGDGIPDIIIGAGAGGGPQVIVYDGSTGNIISSFFAFPAGFRGGVRVAAVQTSIALQDEIVATPGPGGGPMEGIYDSSTMAILAGWYVYNPPGSYAGGLFVAGART